MLSGDRVERLEGEYLSDNMSARARKGRKQMARVPRVVRAIMAQAGRSCWVGAIIDGWSSTTTIASKICLCSYKYIVMIHY